MLWIVIIKATIIAYHFTAVAGLANDLDGFEPSSVSASAAMRLNRKYRNNYAE